jgi:biopolymer transport protein ExbD
MIIHSRRRANILGRSWIDMTPMTDCVFLLLIFFMLTTTFLDVRALQVDLPGAGEQSSEEQQKKKDVNVVVAANGDYIVAGSPVTAEALQGAISGAMDQNNNRNVIIQGDPQTPHKFIVYAMDKAKGAGAEGMAFAYEQQTGERQ